MSASAIEQAWQQFLDASAGLPSTTSGSTGITPSAAMSLSMPIDWPAFYDFVVAVHRLGAQLAYEDVERRLVDSGLSAGEAEDVAGAYWIGREVLAAYDRSSRQM